MGLVSVEAVAAASGPEMAWRRRWGQSLGVRLESCSGKGKEPSVRASGCFRPSSSSFRLRSPHSPTGMLSPPGQPRAGSNGLKPQPRWATRAGGARMAPNPSVKTLPSPPLKLLDSGMCAHREHVGISMGSCWGIPKEHVQPIPGIAISHPLKLSQRQCESPSSFGKPRGTELNSVEFYIPRLRAPCTATGTAAPPSDSTRQDLPFTSGLLLEDLWL